MISAWPVYKFCGLSTHRRRVPAKPTNVKPRGIDLFARRVLQLSQFFSWSLPEFLDSRKTGISRAVSVLELNEVPAFMYGNAQCFSGFEPDYFVDCEHQRIRKKRMKFPRYTLYIYNFFYIKFLSDVNPNFYINNCPTG